jgi:pentatricopeptide repeat protein
MMSDKVIFKNVLNAVLDKGKQVHACIVKAALESLVFVENAFVDMYSKSQSQQDVHQVFDNISICDLVSWSKVILAYAHHNHGQEALQLFEQMQQEGAMPDLITLMGVLSGLQ